MSDFFGFGSDPSGGYDYGNTADGGGTVYTLPPTYGGTVYGSDGSDSPGGINWNNILNQAFGVGSQAIQAFGRNPTQQIASYGVTGVGGGYSPASALAAAQQRAGGVSQYNALTPAQQSALLAQQQGLGSSVGGGVDGIINWAVANPVPVFLGLAGVFLLFRDPPRGGRR